MSTSNLPSSVANMATAIAASINQAGANTTNGFYGGMDKYGTHFYGADRTEVNPNDKWAGNIEMFTHGFVAWGTAAHGTEGKNVGEVMVPITQPLPLESDLPEVKGEWSKAICMQLKCIEGEDEGVQILWKSNSYGGRKAYGALMTQVMEKLNDGDAACFPVMQLLSDSYNHKKYGKIFTPEFKVVGWMTQDGVRSEEPAKLEDASEDEESSQEEPRRRRRKAS